MLFRSEPKMDEKEGFQLVPTAFTIETSRKALAEIVIIDELSFRFVEWYGFQRFLTTLQPKLHIETSHLIKLWLRM